jgi:hypothetical protein
MKWVKDFSTFVAIAAMGEIAVWILIFIALFGSFAVFDTFGIKDSGTQILLFVGFIFVVALFLWKTLRREDY